MYVYIYIYIYIHIIASPLRARTWGTSNQCTAHWGPTHNYNKKPQPAKQLQCTITFPDPPPIPPIFP